jgi:hypothetical protein
VSVRSPAMADAPVTSPAEQIAELGTQLAWVRDYL